MKMLIAISARSVRFDVALPTLDTFDAFSASQALLGSGPLEFCLELLPFGMQIFIVIVFFYGAAQITIGATSGVCVFTTQVDALDVFRVHWFPILLLLVFPRAKHQEFLSLPAGHVGYGTVGRVSLCFGVLPRAMFTVRFDEVETQCLDGYIELLAHLSQPLILTKPKSDPLVTMTAHGH